MIQSLIVLVLLETSDYLSKCHVHKDFLTYKMQKLPLPLITFFQNGHQHSDGSFLFIKRIFTLYYLLILNSVNGLTLKILLISGE